jgi:two-component system, NtrC family, nitrogen regulation response regulator GlnG
LQYVEEGIEKMPSSKPTKKCNEDIICAVPDRKTSAPKQSEAANLSIEDKTSTPAFRNGDSVVPIEVAGWGITDAYWKSISQTCAVCGARLNRLTTLQQVHDFSQNNRHSTAIVALEESTDNTYLSVVSIFKNADIKVIAYKDFLNTWPIGIKCRALLAGVGYFIDSSATEFRERLFSCFKALLASRREEASKIKKLEEIAEARGIIGNSESLMSALQQLIRASTLSDLPVLISGESGTGKELFASALHALDPKRNNKPFISVNCAAISSGVADSELFGHVKGAFTNASHYHNGYFLAAQNGMLFLDEIGELNLEIQAKLLRALQEKRFFQIGSAQETLVDIRIVAATNQNLSQMVKQGSFREDLFHRLNALSVHIDPLRKRISDLPLLIDHIIASHKSWCGEVKVDREVIEACSRLELKGNMRELGNLITTALTARANHPFLGITDLPKEVLEELYVAHSEENNANQLGPDSEATTKEIDEPELNKAPIGQDLNLKACLNQREHEVLRTALQRTHHNQSEAARLMGITPRNMYNKLRKFDMLSRPKA